MVAAHQLNDFWTLMKNPHYWQKGVPKTDKITVRIITDDSARLAALQSGTVDIANFENPDAPLLLKSVPNVKVVSQITPDLYTLVLNSVWPDSPFRDERLRQAVFYALDRQQIRDVALSGQGEVSSAAAVIFKDGCPPPGDTRNVAKAKELVAAAGGLSFEMIVQSSQAIQRIAQVIQQNLADAGINPNSERRRRRGVRGQGVRARQVPGGPAVLVRLRRPRHGPRSMVAERVRGHRKLRDPGSQIGGTDPG